MTVLDVTSLLMAAARMERGRDDRGAKKAELCTFMLPEVTNTYSS